MAINPINVGMTPCIVVNTARLTNNWRKKGKRIQFIQNMMTPICKSVWPTYDKRESICDLVTGATDHKRVGEGSSVWVMTLLTESIHGELNKKRYSPD